jgi:hypothetical protein
MKPYKKLTLNQFLYTNIMDYMAYKQNPFKIEKTFSIT